MKNNLLESILLEAILKEDVHKVAEIIKDKPGVLKYGAALRSKSGSGMLHKVTVSSSKELFRVYEPCPYNPIMTQKDWTEGLICYYDENSWRYCHGR